MSGVEHTSEGRSLSTGRSAARRSLSVSFGRWAGIDIRLHLLFGLFAAGTLIFAWRESQLDATGGIVRLALTCLAVLLGSVGLHEWSHARVAIRFGGFVDRIELVPWGGWSDIILPPHAPRSEVLVYIAGPVANGVVCLICIVVIGIWDSLSTVPELFHPLAPRSIFEGGDGLSQVGWIFGVKLSFWINWLLLVVNLIPAFPFDGEHMTRALLMIYRPAMSRRQVRMAMTWVTRLAALLLCVAAYCVQQYGSATQMTWLALLLLGVLLLFRDRQRDGPFIVSGYAKSDGVSELPPRGAQPVVSGESNASAGLEAYRWDSERPQRSERDDERGDEWDDERDDEGDDERRLDEILERLHKSGRESLSARDQACLDRVSRRLRRRQGR